MYIKCNLVFKDVFPGQSLLQNDKDDEENDMEDEEINWESGNQVKFYNECIIKALNLWFDCEYVSILAAVNWLGLSAWSFNYTLPILTPSIELLCQLTFMSSKNFIMWLTMSNFFSRFAFTTDSCRNKNCYKSCPIW